MQDVSNTEQLEYVPNPCRFCPNQGCGLYHSKCMPYIKFVAYRRQLSQLKTRVARERNEAFAEARKKFKQDKKKRYK